MVKINQFNKNVFIWFKNTRNSQRQLILGHPVYTFLDQATTVLSLHILKVYLLLTS